MTNEKLSGIVDELRVIRTATKKEIAFFNLSGKKKDSVKFSSQFRI